MNTNGAAEGTLLFASMPGDLLLPLLLRVLVSVVEMGSSVGAEVLPSAVLLPTVASKLLLLLVSLSLAVVVVAEVVRVLPGSVGLAGEVVTGRTSSFQTLCAKAGRGWTATHRQLQEDGRQWKLG